MLIKNFRTQSRVMVWKRLQKEPEIVFLLLLLLLFFKCFLFFLKREERYITDSHQCYKDPVWHYCLSNFSLSNKLFCLLPSSHNNLLLSDCIPFFPSPFLVHFCSHSVLVMLKYSTLMRSRHLVSSDANAFSCAVGQRFSFVL